MPLQAAPAAAPRGSRRRCCRLPRRRRCSWRRRSCEAAPPPSPLPVAATNGHVPAAALDIADRLLEIVSERTGYPREMLELDADLEADLGIDSIKRVEIVGTMIQSLTLADGVTPDVEELTSTPDAARGDRGARGAQRPRGRWRRVAGCTRARGGRALPF